MNMSDCNRSALRPALFLSLLLALFAAPGVHAETTAWEQLQSESRAFVEQGKYAEAVAAENRALDAATQALGPNHAEVASILHSLAKLHEDQGQYAQAEPLFLRALTLREMSLGSDHPDVATSANGLAEVHYFQGHYAEAEALFERALAIREKALGPDDAKVGESLNNLGIVSDDLGKYSLAEALYARALSVREKALGPDHPDVAETLNNFANLHVDQGRYARAEPLYQRALAIYEKANGPDDVNVALPLNNLAVLYDVEGQFAQAEPLYKREIAIYEKAQGPNHPDVAVAVHNLAHIYFAEGQFALAEALYQRGQAIYEKSVGPDHPHVATDLNNLGNLYRVQGRFAEALPLITRGLAIREKALGAEHADVANSLTMLAQLYTDQGRYAEAEPNFLRAIAINEKALGTEHADVALGLNNLAALYRAQGAYAKAEPLYLRALAIREKALRPDHPDVATSLKNLAGLYSDSSRPALALAFARRATTIYRRRIIAGGVNEAAAREAAKNRPGFLQHLALLAANPEHEAPSAIAAEALQVVQLEQASGTESAIAKMAVRFANGSDELANLVRGKQDAVSSLASVEAQLVKAVSKPPEKRNAAGEQELRNNSARLARVIDGLDAQLTRRFPEYQELTRPEPLDVRQVQALLRQGEAMLVYAFGGKSGGFLWIVKPDMASFVPLAVDADALASKVELVRRQMDIDDRNQPLPVSLDVLHDLYSALFAPALPALAGVRHLMVVPEGPLVSLPLGMLVASEPPPIKNSSDYRKVDWLIRHYVISVLPSVSSIRAFRQFAKAPGRQKPFIGFGDPLLDGGMGTGSAQHRGVNVSAVFRNLGLNTLAHAPAADQASPIADVEAIRSQMRLPETALELAAMAKTLGAGSHSIWLREQATVTKVKQLDLANYRTIAFATHGVMAGEGGELGVGEPGLILTPPRRGTTEDDGYLSASKIAQLKLNADWVLLSACNTAAADGKPSAEGFSGLAKAFFYAGSRSLLVSNWWVNSEATVALTTTMLKKYQAHPESGKAEAHRAAMLALMNTPGHAEFAHPLYWAPFVVVGEGGAAR